MPRTLTCPGCQRTLRVPDDVTTAEVTCPRCLAQVANPNVGEAISETPSGETLCPRCGKRVEKQWRFCPHCEAVLWGPRRGARGGYLDDEVRRDRRGTSVILILLAVLGGLGLLAYFGSAVAVLSGGDAEKFPDLLTPVAVGILVVLLLAGIATAIMFYRTRHDPSQRGVGRVVVGTLALTGGLIGLSCVLAVAGFLFVFIACLVNPPRFH